MESTKVVKTALNLRYEPEVFVSPALAKSSLLHRTKQCWTIILGCDGRYWVVCFSDANRLMNAGYELAIL